MDENSLQKIIQLSKELGTKETEIERLFEELKYRDKRIKYLEDELIRNGIKLQEEIENNTHRKLVKPRKSGKQKFDEALEKLKKEGKI